MNDLEFEFAGGDTGVWDYEARLADGRIVCISRMSFAPGWETFGRSLMTLSEVGSDEIVWIAQAFNRWYQRNWERRLAAMRAKYGDGDDIVTDMQTSPEQQPIQTIWWMPPGTNTLQRMRMEMEVDGGG